MIDKDNKMQVEVGYWQDRSRKFNKALSKSMMTFAKQKPGTKKNIFVKKLFKKKKETK